MDQNNDAVFIIGLDEVHLEVNQQAADLLGYTADELVGMHIKQIIKPQEYPESQKNLNRLLSGEKSIRGYWPGLFSSSCPFSRPGGLCGRGPPSWPTGTSSWSRSRSCSDSPG